MVGFGCESSFAALRSLQESGVGSRHTSYATRTRSKWRGRACRVT